jgi:hypothetical protein
VRSHIAQNYRCKNFDTPGTLLNEDLFSIVSGGITFGDLLNRLRLAFESAGAIPIDFISGFCFNSFT